jgi:hypothetical protein
MVTLSPLTSLTSATSLSSLTRALTRILVNIQNEDFECHKLNRDVWKDEIIQQIVQCYFLFWQQRFNSEYGEQFCHMYKIKETELPYIAIIDPRTGTHSLTHSLTQSITQSITHSLTHSHLPVSLQ